MSDISIIMAAIATAVELVIFLYLYRENSEPFLWWWNVGWFCYTLYWVCQIMDIITNGTSLWNPLEFIFAGLSVFFSCASGLAYRQSLEFRALYGVGIGFYSLIVLAASVFPESLRIGFLIAALMVCGGYWMSAVLFFPTPSQQMVVKGAAILSVSQVLRGGIWFIAPFICKGCDWNTVMTASATLFHQLAVMAMIILVLEHSKQRALALTRRLEQAERLATLGEWAAGMAHEIRNPLGAIVNAVHTLGHDAEDLSPKERTTLSSVVQEEASRVNRLLTDFVQYAKPATPQRVVGNLNPLLSEVAALLRRDTGLATDIDIREELASEPPLAAFDADQLRQAIWNIAKNGIESMQPGQALYLGSQTNNGEVEIRIQDTGRGIAGEDVDNIFQPFYSRKAQGTGLGLAIAARIVADHQGQLDVASQLGKGTTFTIRLQRAEG